MRIMKFVVHFEGVRRGSCKLAPLWEKTCHPYRFAGLKAVDAAREELGDPDFPAELVTMDFDDSWVGESEHDVEISEGLARSMPDLFSESYVAHVNVPTLGLDRYVRVFLVRREGEPTVYWKAEVDWDEATRDWAAAGHPVFWDPVGGATWNEWCPDWCKEVLERKPGPDASCAYIREYEEAASKCRAEGTGAARSEDPGEDVK